MAEIESSTRTLRITTVVVILTAVGLVAGWVIMRPDSFGQRVLTFILGVALAGLMLLAIERFNKDAVHEAVLENEFEARADDTTPISVSKVPPPPTSEQWERLRRERDHRTG
jgi:hypothetical protein